MRPSFLARVAGLAGGISVTDITYNFDNSVRYFTQPFRRRHKLSAKRERASTRETSEEAAFPEWWVLRRFDYGRLPALRKLYFRPSRAYACPTRPSRATPTQIRLPAAAASRAPSWSNQRYERNESVPRAQQQFRQRSCIRAASKHPSPPAQCPRQCAPQLEPPVLSLVPRWLLAVALQQFLPHTPFH